MSINIFKSTPKVNARNYFPELDGLRGLAVIFVFIFHLDENNIFKGGFIGVDIFFVISGFLITGILYQQINSNRFNYKNFIEARIARLYPALLVTIILSLIMGYLIYTPTYFLNEVKSGIFATISLSNWYFSEGVGYWDISQTENPFLHTWSLGVEQQFYLIWPLLLFFILKVKKYSYVKLSYILILLAVFSFGYSLYLGASNNQTYAFYFTLTRIFELSSGGLLFLFSHHNEQLIKKYFSTIKAEIIFGISLILLFCSAIFFDHNYLSYPNFYTLIIIAATIFCLLSAKHARYTRYFLNNPLMVFIGIISYSIYLLHWPIIVFTKYFFYEELNIFYQLSIFLFTIFFSYILYVSVENKFRKITIFCKSNKRVILSWVLFLYVIATQLYILQNFKLNNIKNFKLSAEIQRSLTFGGWNYQYGYQIIGDKSYEPIAIIAGDSFAQMYIEAADEYFKRKKISVIYFANNGCRMLKDIKDWNVTDCVRNMNFYFDLIQEKQLPVIYIQRWFFLNNDKINDDQGNKIKVDLAKVEQELNNIQLLNKNKIMLLGMPPMYLARMDELYNRTHMRGKDFSKYTKIDYQSDKKNVDMNNFIREVASKNTNMEYLSVYDVLCNQNKNECYAIDDNKKSYYYDAYHLSIYGAEIIWGAIGDDIYQFIIKNHIYKKE